METFTTAILEKKLKGLVEALLNVRKEYLAYSTNYLLNFPYKKRGEYKDDIEQVERVFAYELYHQWSLTKPNDLVLNGEIGKRLNDKIKFPDLALHGGQNDYEHNEVVVEIKRFASKGSAFYDLKKLSHYLEGCDADTHFYKYKKAVFILYGCEKKDLTVTKSMKDLNGEIILLFYKGEGVVYSYTLEEILNDAFK